MRSFVSAALWLGVYLALVLAPLVVLLLGEVPAGGGFLWDLSIALGFAGTTMMAVQFLLTARFRRATAPYGIDLIYYFHRYAAVIALVVIVAHPVLLIVDNPQSAAMLDPSFAPLHMVAGSASVVVLVLLAAVSLLRKQLHIPYEAWRLTHLLLALAAIALALSHVYGVSYYSALPRMKVLWVAVGVGVGGIVTYVRVIRPWRIRRRPYRVVSVTPERGDAWTLRLEPERGERLDFQPGQFAWLSLGSSPFAMRDHPFSIASSPALPGAIEITIKELGDFTRTVAKTRAGETAYVDGPYGAFTIDRYDPPGFVFVAGGIGIAPIMSMMRALADRGDPRPVLLFYAYRRRERMTFYEEIESMKQRLRLRVVHVLEEPPEGWAEESGRVTTELLDRHLPADRDRLEHFICGPTAMIRSVEHSLRRLGVPMACYHSEIFDLA